MFKQVLVIFIISFIMSLSVLSAAVGIRLFQTAPAVPVAVVTVFVIVIDFVVSAVVVSFWAELSILINLMFTSNNAVYCLA